jgi:FG-GAP-like repeat
MPQNGTEVSATVISTGNATAVRTRIYEAPYTSVPQNIEATLSNASALATADLNGDGSGDLVVVNGNRATSSYIAVMLGKSDGTFQSPASYTTAGNYTVVAVIDDVNGDGKLDVITLSADQQISVLLGKGDGTFAAAPTPAFPYAFDALSANWPNIASGDINRDGKIDIVVDNGATISVWMGNGDGTFTLGDSYAAINTTGFTTLSDLDGDGSLDIYTGLANGGLYSGDDSNASIAYV